MSLCGSFQNISIKYKLLIGFSLVVFMLAAFGLYLVSTLNTVEGSLAKSMRQYQILIQLSRLDKNNGLLAESVKAFTITKNYRH